MDLLWSHYEEIPQSMWDWLCPPNYILSNLFLLDEYRLKWKNITPPILADVFVLLHGLQISFN
jgi:hypothetical protein